MEDEQDNLGNGPLWLSAKIERKRKKDGEFDASTSGSPLAKDRDYLDGYFSEMRRRIEAGNCKLEIIWRLLPNKN